MSSNYSGNYHTGSAAPEGYPSTGFPNTDQWRRTSAPRSSTWSGSQTHDARGAPHAEGDTLEKMTGRFKEWYAGTRGVTDRLTLDALGQMFEDHVKSGGATGPEMGSSEPPRSQPHMPPPPSGGPPGGSRSFTQTQTWDDYDYPSDSDGYEYEYEVHEPRRHVARRSTWSADRTEEEDRRRRHLRPLSPPGGSLLDDFADFINIFRLFMGSATPSTRRAPRREERYSSRFPRDDGYEHRHDRYKVRDDEYEDNYHRSKSGYHRHKERDDRRDSRRGSSRHHTRDHTDRGGRGSSGTYISYGTSRGRPVMVRRR